MEDRLHAPLFFSPLSSQRVACPVSGRYSAGMPRRFLIAALACLLLGEASLGFAQQRPAPADSPGQAPGPTVPMTVLADQLVDLFPKVEGDVLEVQDGTLTLSVGRKDGARPGLELGLFREGREIKHPKTGQVLGRSEMALGRVTITEVEEQFSRGTATATVPIAAGDRFRLSSGKIRLVLLPLAGGARDALIEATTQELVERLNGSGRFVVSLGDSLNLYLAQEGIKGDDFLDGKGVKEAAARFKFENLLVLQFKRVQNRPFMEVRFFSLPSRDALVNTAFFVPPTIRTAADKDRFSSATRDVNRPQAKPRSLLSRLLGGDLEAGSYSTGENSIPLREVARFGFPVLAMDISVQPKDKIPRVAVSDGEKIYQYRIVNQKFEPEWSFAVGTLGRVMSIQLVDVDGDGIFEVVANRYHNKAGLNSFVITAKEGKPKFLANNLEMFLFALDAKNEGHKQTLWAQRYNSDTFFTPGQAEQVVIKKGGIVSERSVRVPASFRPMGAAFSNINGKDTRALAHIDEFNRLLISLDGEDLWRSSTTVGGGYMKMELVIERGRQGSQTKFYKIEPTPLAVDLDGDGIDELVVPQNQIREGLLAVVFKGPAGYRLQSIDSGFEGGITSLGAFRTDDSNQPTLVAAVVRFNSLFSSAGETQIIMTMPQE
jgi:hypothetical protein